MSKSLDLYPLAALNDLLANKAFRDKLLKTLQYVCKLWLQQLPALSLPRTGEREVVQVLSEHISIGRRLYRFGQFFKGLETLLLLPDTPSVSVKMVAIGLIRFFADLFDSLSYWRSVTGASRVSADYWSAFFYVSGLTIALYDTFTAFVRNLVRTRKAHTNREATELASQRQTLLLDAFRIVGDALTASRSLSSYFDNKKSLVALGGIVGGAIGSCQLYPRLLAQRH